ncbi:MAG: hypothetical protein JRH15_18650, partial [Deltaproteobacteria bacterium]|nr:hypothetical protein [Deltaproteobacteria bacterium]
MNRMMWPRTIIAPFSAAMIFLCACSVKMDRSIAPYQEKAAADLYQVLIKNNRKLTTIKGVGRLVLMDDAGQRFRAAWIGKRPNRLRMEFLGISGLPVASFSSDGEWHYLMDHTRRRFYRKRAGSSDLKRLISVPVNAGEILELMCG